MDTDLKRNLLEYLLQFVSDNKQAKFRELIQHRTRYLTVVLEDIFQPHNASAVLRTCDCFGIQDVHIIENRNRYRINPDVALGSVQWITLLTYKGRGDNTSHCLHQLRANGYTLVATSPHRNDYILEELPLDKKTALLFGTELQGLSQTALAMADCSVRIPIAGFTESFNISVSVAISLYALTTRLSMSPVSWPLSEEERIDVMLDWVRNVVKRPDLLEKEFINSWMKKI